MPIYMYVASVHRKRDLILRPTEPQKVWATALVGVACDAKTMFALAAAAALQDGRHKFSKVLSIIIRKTIFSYPRA